MSSYRFVSPGIDGQVFSEDGKYLYAAHNEANEIYQFKSDSGNWDAMTLVKAVKTRYSVPTSIALTSANQTMWAISSYWNLLGITDYPLQLISFLEDDDSSSCSSGSSTNNLNDDFSELEWALVLFCLALLASLGWCFLKNRKLEQRMQRGQPRDDYVNLGM